jgi:hypothetical protein
LLRKISLLVLQSELEGKYIGSFAPPSSLILYLEENESLKIRIISSKLNLTLYFRAEGSGIGNFTT